MWNPREWNVWLFFMQSSWFWGNFAFRNFVLEISTVKVRSSRYFAPSCTQCKLGECRKRMQKNAISIFFVIESEVDVSIWVCCQGSYQKIVIRFQTYGLIWLQSPPLIQLLLRRTTFICIYGKCRQGCLCFGLCGPHQCSTDTGADTWQKQALYHMPGWLTLKKMCKCMHCRSTTFSLHLHLDSRTTYQSISSRCQS